MNSNFQIFRKLPDGFGQIFVYEHSDAAKVGAHLEKLVQEDEQSVFAVYGSYPAPLFTFQGHWNGNPALAQ